MAFLGLNCLFPMTKLSQTARHFGNCSAATAASKSASTTRAVKAEVVGSTWPMRTSEPSPMTSWQRRETEVRPEPSDRVASGYAQLKNDSTVVDRSHNTVDTCTHWYSMSSPAAISVSASMAEYPNATGGVDALQEGTARQAVVASGQEEVEVSNGYWNLPSRQRTPRAWSLSLSSIRSAGGRKREIIRERIP